MTERFTRLAPSAAPDVDAANNTVDYQFSDESVGRDGHIVKNSAWQLDNFQKNPVFLWAHDDSQPPIGRVTNLRVAGGALRGSVRYAPTPFAASIYQLVRGKFLNAVSTSWQPLQYDRMADGSSGLIFTSVDLLEISQVPIPALPTALATARKRINTRPIYEWAVAAIDRKRFGNIDRPLIEAICRAARPVSAGRGKRQAIARAWQARVQEQNVDDLLQDDGEVGRALRAERAERLKAGPVARTTPTLAALGYDHHQVDRGEDKLARCLEHHRALRRSLGHAGVAVDSAAQELEDTVKEHGGDGETPLARCLRRISKHLERAAAHNDDATESCTSLGNTLDDMDNDDPVPDMTQTGPTE